MRRVVEDPQEAQRRAATGAADASQSAFAVARRRGNGATPGGGEGTLACQGAGAVGVGAAGGRVGRSPRPALVDNARERPRPTAAGGAGGRAAGNAPVHRAPGGLRARPAGSPGGFERNRRADRRSVAWPVWTCRRRGGGEPRRAPASGRGGVRVAATPGRGRGSQGRFGAFAYARGSRRRPQGHLRQSSGARCGPRRARRLSRDAGCVSSTFDHRV